MHDLSLFVFLDNNYKQGTVVCNSCYNISMMPYELENIAILNVKGMRCLIWNMTRNDAINRLNNSKLDDKVL